MPLPAFNWSPQGAGWRKPIPPMGNPGWIKPIAPLGAPWPQNISVPAEAYQPSYTRNWSPGPGLDWGYTPAIAHRTEAGAAMMSKGNPMNGMNGMGDMFTYPQGTNPSEFFAQQARTGAMPTPGMPIPINIQGEQMAETYLYDRPIGQAPQVGQMPWESGPAPWEQTALPNNMMGPVYPGDAPHEIARMHADRAAEGDAKAVQAAQAAKIAADNAVRAAKAGAPQIAVTNAATAQAAASVAAQAARGAHGQRAAAVAANEATKALAAANVVANSVARNGMGDWMELSGLGATGLLARKVPLIGITYQTALMLGGVTALAVWGFPWLKKKLK